MAEQLCCGKPVIHYQPGPPAYWECQSCGHKYAELPAWLQEKLRESAMEFFGYGKPRS